MKRVCFAYTVTMNKKQKIDLSYLLWTLLPLAVGGLSALISSDGMKNNALLPQPALRNGPDAEALVKGAAPYEDIWAIGPEGYVLGVRADADGPAWFREIAPGDYTFAAGGERLCATLALRGDAALKPGFEGIPTLHFNKKHEGENEDALSLDR